MKGKKGRDIVRSCSDCACALLQHNSAHTGCTVVSCDSHRPLNSSNWLGLVFVAETCGVFCEC